MNKSRLFYGLVVIGLLLGVLFGYGQPFAQGEKETKSRDPKVRFLKDDRSHSIPYGKIKAGGPPVDGIPSLDRPDRVPVSESQRLKSRDRLLVVSVDGNTVGYPIRILNYHELVNDVVGDRPVLITWCPLCGSGMVFDRRVDGEAHSFGVSGLLYQSDVLFYDRTTDSLWSQLEAKAVVGPKTGTELTRVPHVSMAWSNFRREYPNGHVLSFETGYERDYSRNPYSRYRQQSDVMFPVENRDRRLGNKDSVVGVELNDHSVAYPRKRLENRRVVVDRLGEQAIVLLNQGGAIRAYKITDAAADVLRKMDGSPAEQGWTITEDALIEPGDRRHPRLEHTDSYWFAWATFHPGTDLWRAQSR
jgi:hypothetical protein